MADDVDISAYDDVDISAYMEDIKKWCKDPQRLLEYEKSIREAIEQNKKADDFLRTSAFISDDLWDRIVDAISYDSASTAGWAITKLNIIYERVQSGERIFVPSIDIYLEKSNFEAVICKTFSRVIFGEILKLYRSR
ncbi:MAG TPA: hypothetical protein DDW50_16065 [Firmicutes bacterium]|jgi:hypothetical protein|nr:hypothetical protein [Bacillota bacterium]